MLVTGPPLTAARPQLLACCLAWLAAAASLPVSDGRRPEPSLRLDYLKTFISVPRHPERALIGNPDNICFFKCGPLHNRLFLSGWRIPHNNRPDHRPLPWSRSGPVPAVENVLPASGSESQTPAPDLRQSGSGSRDPGLGGESFLGRGRETWLGCWVPGPGYWH